MKTTSLYTYCKILLVVVTFLFSARVHSQTTLLAEDWESAAIGQTPPSGWSIDLGNSTNHLWFKQQGINPTCYPSSGNRLVEFQTVQYGYGIHDRLRRTVPFSTLGFVAVNVDFKWFTSTLGQEYSDRVVVEYSINGTNWVNVGTFYRHSWDNTWRYENINLPSGALNSPNVYIAFHFYGWVGENCHLDDVHVTGYATAPTPPTVTTSTATYVASTLAHVTGSVNANGNTTSTRFQYGLTTGYGNECESSTVTGNTTIPISVILGYQEPLLPGKTYHYRAVGNSAGGFVYGMDHTFTTLDTIPTAITGDATAITTNSATIQGNVSANGDTTTVVFEYGTTTSYGSIAPATPNLVTNDSTFVNVFASLTSLNPGTLYHYRVKATNSLGTAYGVDSTFFTSGNTTIPPTAITSGVTNISLNGATLNGMVNPNGSTTNTTFQYGLTTSYGNTVSCGSQSGTTLLPVSYSLSGLSQNTVYHYRVVATNQYGTAYGYDSTFTTLQPANCQAYFTTYPDSLNNQMIHFWDQSSGAGINTYTWSFGDGTSQTVTFPQNPNVSHNYNNPGVYVACLHILSYDSSCNSTYCVNVTVGASTSCDAEFTFSQVSNNTFDFYDQSSGNIVSWLWNFGDPSSGASNYSTLQNSTHAFTTPGTYYVCLTVQGLDSTCYDISCDTIVVPNYGSCVANFAYSSNPTTTVPTQFTDLSQSSGGTISSWFWVFGDPASGTNNVSTLQNPTHQFSDAGIYQVCLTIQNADSTCYDYICKYIEVTSGGTTCTAMFESIPDSTSYYTYHFFDQSYPAIESWSWSFGDGTTSTLQNPTHTYTFPNTYYVCLTVTSNNGNCTDTYCDTIIIISCQSYFTYVKNMRTVNFTGHMVNSFPSSYFWDFGDGNNGQGETIQHTYSSAGTYTVTLMTEDWLDCTFTSQQQVVVVDSSQNYNVYGQVFGGNFPINSGVALLFQIDSIFPYSVLADTCMIDSLGVYYFTEVPEGDYYIYAIPFYPIGYLPTYYGNSLNWNSASLISLGSPTNPYNIQLILADSLLPGNGSIHGQINVAKSNNSDLTDKIMVILMNKNYQAIATTKIDKDGGFEFTQLAYGTYLIKPELAGINSDLISVDLSESTPDTTLTFTFSGNQILGYKALVFEYTVGPIFPNPVKEDAHLMLQSDKNGLLNFEILTISGAFAQQMRQEIVPGTNLITLPTSGLLPGFYFIRITDVNTGLSITKKLIKTD